MDSRKEEQVLVRRMLAGEESAFDEFADAYVPALYRFASRRLAGDRELVREVVQATVCNAIAKLASFRGEAALMTWLCACCRNEIGGHFRRRRRSAGEVELETVEAAAALVAGGAGRDDPERAAAQREDARRVHAVLDALPPHYGRVLEWKYLEDLSLHDIGERLQLGPKAVESLLTRARQSFRDGYARSAAGHLELEP